MSDRLKPIMDSTYPAVMAGLCLTFLGIYQDGLDNCILIFSISTASFFFVLSSFYTFIYSVNIEWKKETENIVPTNNKVFVSWKIAKYSFLLGISLLVIATILVIYDLWLHNSLKWILDNLLMSQSENLTLLNTKN